MGTHAAPAATERPKGTLYEIDDSVDYHMAQMLSMVGNERQIDWDEFIYNHSVSVTTGLVINEGSPWMFPPPFTNLIRADHPQWPSSLDIHRARILRLSRGPPTPSGCICWFVSKTPLMPFASQGWTPLVMALCASALCAKMALGYGVQQVVHCQARRE